MPAQLFRPLLALPLLMVIAAAACERRDHPDPDIAATDPRQPGPHGGTLLRTLDRDVRAEFVHEPQQQRILLYIMDGQLNPLEPESPPQISLIVGGTPLQLRTEPLADQPAAFAATHEVFAGEDFLARVNIAVRGQVLQVELADHHHRH